MTDWWDLLGKHEPAVCERSDGSSEQQDLTRVFGSNMQLKWAQMFGWNISKRL